MASSSVIGEDFCGSHLLPLLDVNVTWNGDTLTLSYCFTNTLLIWLPCLLFWLLIAFEIFSISDRTLKVLSTPNRRILYGIRLIILSLLAFVVLFRLVNLYLRENMLYGQTSVPIILAHSVLFITFATMIGLTMYQYKMAVLSYGIQWVSFLTFICCATIEAFSDKTELSDDLDYYLYLIEYALYIVCLVVFSWSEPEDAYLIDWKKDWPEFIVSFPKRLFFIWMKRLLWRGFRKGLTLEDLWSIHKRDCSSFLYNEFKTQLDAFKSDDSKNATSPKRTQTWYMIRVIFRTHWKAVLFSGGLALTYALLTFVGPLSTLLLMYFVENKKEPHWHGYLYVLLIVVSQILRSWCWNHQTQIICRVGINLKSSVVAAVYRKALFISSEAKKHISMGEIVNLVSIDATRLTDLAPYIHILWVAPLQIVAGFTILYNVVGSSCLSGLAVYVLVLCLNAGVAKFFKDYQDAQMANKDERLKHLTEIFNGIKVIKLYAWEKAFQKQISDIRAKEIHYLRKMAFLNGAIEISWSCTNLMACFAIYATYLATSGSSYLSAVHAFVVLTILNVLYIPLTMIPLTATQFLLCYVSLGRIGRFLAAEEIEEYVEKDDGSRYSIQFINGNFGYMREGKTDLRNLNLNIKQGDLIAIVGPVGSGKSSFIAALIGDLYKRSGQVIINGSLAYVPQQAWIQSMTVKNNILFSKQFDVHRYKVVVDACALKADFESLPAGDQTELGEAGVNLSGGQKQRISLARSVYQDCEIYLLDDPLSAVDVNVGKHIFEKVVGSNGVLKNKTRIFVTHGIGYLKYCNLIAVMKDGRMEEVGTYGQLIKRGGVFKEFLTAYFAQLCDDINSSDEELLQHLNESDDNAIGAHIKKQVGIAQKNPRSSNTTTSSEKTLLVDQDTSESINAPKPSDAGKLLVDEEVAVTRVPWSVYVLYAKVAGKWFIVHLIFTGFVQSVYVFAGFWLEIWTTKKYDWRLGLGVYGIGTIFIILFTITYVAAMIFACTRASTLLHNNLLTNLLHCPMSFFDSTPIGRIMNRCSKDIDVIDIIIPMAISNVSAFLWLYIATIIVVTYATPYFIIPLIPVMIIYGFIQHFYVKSSRQLRRLEAITRSPINCHLQESVSGASSIRAFRQTDRFAAHLDNLIDHNAVAQLSLISTNNWLGIYLDFIGTFTAGSAALLTVLTRNQLTPGIVGLSISFILSVTDLLQWGVKEVGLLETEIVALERVNEYTNISREADLHTEFGQELKSWPSKGVVEFRNYSTRYRPNLPLVLNNLNCSIRGGEKIGIVGRTGAGKSSITIAVFRLIEPTGGTIFIDDVDITLLGLHDLRSKLTIIPQDPVLFSGTLKSNMDPFHEHNDEELWRVIDLSGMKKDIEEFENKLDYKISESGQNLSVGQRQLVCLWRALLRKSKILILDEATAAVDIKMDALIQQTIRTQFKDCTVITIAHRLNTIMDSKRILVLEQGKLVEFDSPRALVQKPNGIFAQMATQAKVVIRTASRSPSESSTQEALSPKNVSGFN